MIIATLNVESSNSVHYRVLVRHDLTPAPAELKSLLTPIGPGKLLMFGVRENAQNRPQIVKFLGLK